MNDLYIKGRVKVVLLNGPPFAGKDALAKYLVNKDPDSYVHKEFKTKLNEIVRTIYSISEIDWSKLSSRELKEVPSGLLYGLSPRQAQIKISEEVIKPNYGKDYFANALLKNLNQYKINLISDCRFDSEADVFLDELGVSNLLLVRIHRSGCDFSNDSRNYIYNENISSIDIYNESSLEEFLLESESKILEYLK